MLLKNLTVLHLGGLTYFSREFTDSINTVRERYSDELFLAIAAVLNNRSAPCIPREWVCGESRIEAKISANKRSFFVRLAPDEDPHRLKLRAFDETGSDSTVEYLYLASHCWEHDLSDVFSGNEKSAFLRVLHYLNEGERSRGSTDGLIRIKAFRAYVFNYVKNFKAETIRAGKGYEIFLEKNGLYGVRYKDGGDLPVYLSESEQTLFRYLCFLRTAEFWQGFEEIRNLHNVKKPFVIKNFLCRLDESIDTDALLQRTKELGRQIIILS